MNLPSWVCDPTLDENEMAGLLIKYHLRRAALWHNQDASIVQLGVALGMAPTTLHNAIARGTCSRQIALAIEAFVGKEVVSREQLAPQFFATAEA